MTGDDGDHMTHVYTYVHDTMHFASLLTLNYRVTSFLFRFH